MCAIVASVAVGASPSSLATGVSNNRDSRYSSSLLTARRPASISEIAGRRTPNFMATSPWIRPHVMRAKRSRVARCFWTGVMPIKVRKSYIKASPVPPPGPQRRSISSPRKLDQRNSLPRQAERNDHASLDDSRRRGRVQHLQLPSFLKLRVLFPGGRLRRTHLLPELV